MSPCLNTAAYVQLPGTWGGGATVTIEAWINLLLEPDPAGPTGPIADIVSSGAVGEFCHFHCYHPVVANPNPALDPSCAAYVDNNPFIAAAVNVIDTLPLNVWRHEVFVVKTGASNLFENAVQQDGPETQAFTFINTTSNLTIGRGYLGGRYFTGRIAKVAIYAQALTSTRIAAHYAAANAAAYDAAVLADTPLGYWKLDDAAGSTTAADSSGNGRHGTYHGAPYLERPGPYTSDKAALFAVACGGWSIDDIRF